MASESRLRRAAKCVTHHEACACRELAFERLIDAAKDMAVAAQVSVESGSRIDLVAIANLLHALRPLVGDEEFTLMRMRAHEQTKATIQARVLNEGC